MSARTRRLRILGRVVLGLVILAAVASVTYAGSPLDPQLGRN